MKKIFLMLVVALLTLTSCGDNKSENFIATTFKMVGSCNGGENSIFASGVLLRIDFNSQTGTFTIGEIKSPDGETYSNVVVDVPFTFGKTANYEFKATAVNARSGIKDIQLTNFWANCANYDNRIGFTLNGKSYYYIVSSAAFPTSTTTVTNVRAPQSTPYTNSNMQYLLEMDAENKSATLYLYKAKFAEAMPKELDMVFKGLKLETIGTSVIASCESLIPEIAETPYPDYAITNLTVNLSAPDAVITFDCAGAFHVVARATMTYPTTTGDSNGNM